MPAYSFSLERFVPMILNRTKPHTIRPRRKHPTKRGDLLVLYYKQRTAECRAIALTVCKNVQPITMYPFSQEIKLGGLLLTQKRIERLAKQDGFYGSPDFFWFFQQYRQTVLKGFELIHWDVNRMLNLWVADEFQRMLREMRSPVERLAWLNVSVEIGKALDAPESGKIFNANSANLANSAVLLEIYHGEK